jgi:hypothetical protein
MRAALLATLPLAAIACSHAAPAPPAEQAARAGHSVGKPTLRKIQEGADILAFIEWARGTSGRR